LVENHYNAFCEELPMFFMEAMFFNPVLMVSTVLPSRKNLPVKLNT
jgi:hypothetical protein